MSNAECISRILTDFYDEIIKQDPVVVREAIVSTSAFIAGGGLKTILFGEHIRATTLEMENSTNTTVVYPPYKREVECSILPEFLPRVPKGLVAYGKVVEFVYMKDSSVYEYAYVFQHCIIGKPRNTQTFVELFVTHESITEAGYLGANDIFIYQASEKKLLVLTITKTMGSLHTSYEMNPAKLFEDSRILRICVETYTCDPSSGRLRVYYIKDLTLKYAIITLQDARTTVEAPVICGFPNFGFETCVQKSNYTFYDGGDSLFVSYQNEGRPQELAHFKMGRAAVRIKTFTNVSNFALRGDFLYVSRHPSSVATEYALKAPQYYCIDEEN